MCAGLMSEDELKMVPDGVSGKVFLDTKLKISLFYFNFKFFLLLIFSQFQDMTVMFFNFYATETKLIVVSCLNSSSIAR